MKAEIKKKIEVLNQDTRRVFKAIEGLNEQQLQDQTYGWSLIQVMEHLIQSESLSLSYMQKKVKAGDGMKNAGMIHSFKMWLTNQALKSKLKWGAPSYIANPKSNPLEEVQAKWAQLREQLNAFVESYPEKWLNKLVYKHPMGGRQNLTHAVDSFIFHQRHHMHQIDRIKKKIGV